MSELSKMEQLHGDLYDVLGPDHCDNVKHTRKRKAKRYPPPPPGRRRPERRLYPVR